VYNLELDNRLILLKDARQIDEDIYVKIIEIISMFKKRWNIELKEENGAMLITHLCIALQRIKNKSILEKINEELYEEVKLNKHFNTCERVFSDITLELNMDIPESEKSFVMMHLCVLFDKENN
jgi:transcriptional regulatory protein LevR